MYLIECLKFIGIQTFCVNKYFENKYFTVCMCLLFMNKTFLQSRGLFLYFMI